MSQTSMRRSPFLTRPTPPGGVSTVRDVRASDLSRVWHTPRPGSPYVNRQLIAVGGTGPYLIDDEGRYYLDASAGLESGSVILGYGNHRITDAMALQLAEAPCLDLSAGSHVPAVALAERLTGYAPEGLNTVMYITGGRQGVRDAVDLARNAHDRRGEWERRTAIHLTPSRRAPRTVLDDDAAVFVQSGRAPDSSEDLRRLRDAVEMHGRETIAAVVVEPIPDQTVLPQPREYLRGCRALCDEIGAYLVFDESAIAPGRSGSMFAAGLYDQHPDMLVLGTGLTAGYAALGAVVIDEQIVELCQSGGGRYLAPRPDEGGQPVACAAALAVFDVIETDELLDKVTNDGAYLREGLRTVAYGPHVGAPRGPGLLIALDLLDPGGGEASPLFADAVVAEARRRGVLLSNVDNVLVIRPPFVCGRAELDLIAETVSESITAVTEPGQWPDVLGDDRLTANRPEGVR
jgi:adenosylmethionine-8-amino-7-oxononanoate aminotransferase